jgi:hypothetical protein
MSRSSGRQNHRRGASDRSSGGGTVEGRSGAANSADTLSARGVIPEWSPWARRLASLCLVYHCLAMFVSPWAVPPSSVLVQQLEQYVAHYQTLLYLNHGYRFFAPDPGPATIVRFEIQRSDGSQISGVFPDRAAINRDYPRLMYHRWFMWAETLGRFLGDWVSPEEFARFVELERQEIQRLRDTGEFDQAEQNSLRLQEDQRLWGEAAAERERLLEPVARVLLERYEGLELRLALQRRLIPSRDEVRLGVRPSDPRLLDPQDGFELGRWRWDPDRQAAEPVRIEEALAPEISSRGSTDGINTRPSSGATIDSGGVLPAPEGER